MYERYERSSLLVHRSSTISDVECAEAVEDIAWRDGSEEMERPALRDHFERRDREKLLSRNIAAKIPGTTTLESCSNIGE